MESNNVAAGRKHSDVVRTFMGEPVQARASQGELAQTRGSQCEPVRDADDVVARGGFFGFIKRQSYYGPDSAATSKLRSVRLVGWMTSGLARSNGVLTRVRYPCEEGKLQSLIREMGERKS